MVEVLSGEERALALYRSQLAGFEFSSGFWRFAGYGLGVASFIGGILSQFNGDNGLILGGSAFIAAAIAALQPVDRRWKARQAADHLREAIEGRKSDGSFWTIDRISKSALEAMTISAAIKKPAKTKGKPRQADDAGDSSGEDEE